MGGDPGELQRVLRLWSASVSVPEGAPPAGSGVRTSILTTSIVTSLAGTDGSGRHPIRQGSTDAADAGPTETHCSTGWAGHHARLKDFPADPARSCQRERQEQAGSAAIHQPDPVTDDRCRRQKQQQQDGQPNQRGGAHHDHFLAPGFSIAAMAVVSKCLEGRISLTAAWIGRSPVQHSGTGQSNESPQINQTHKVNTITPPITP